MFFLSTSPNKILDLSTPSDKNNEKILCFNNLCSITLSKKGIEFFFENVGKDKPRIPSNGTFVNDDPSSLWVRPKVWSGIVIPAIVTKSFTNSPIILPVPYFIEKTEALP